jgi:hypothetical protein
MYVHAKLTTQEVQVCHNVKILTMGVNQFESLSVHHCQGLTQRVETATSGAAAYLSRADSAKSESG